MATIKGGIEEKEYNLGEESKVSWGIQRLGALLAAEAVIKGNHKLAVLGQDIQRIAAGEIPEGIRNMMGEQSGHQTVGTRI